MRKYIEVKGWGRLFLWDIARCMDRETEHLTRLGSCHALLRQWCSAWSSHTNENSDSDGVDELMQADSDTVEYLAYNERAVEKLEPSIWTFECPVCKETVDLPHYCYDRDHERQGE